MSVLDKKRQRIKSAVSDASEFLRNQCLMPDNDGANQTVRMVIYALACEGWEVEKTRERTG